MMRKLILGLFIVTFLGTIQSYGQDLKWYNWEEGYAKAVKEKKIILLDAYTDWCYWCKVMDKKTFSQDKVKEKINKHFIAIKLNPEKAGTYKFDGKSYSGKTLIAKLSQNKFSGYPTTFFVFPKNKSSFMEVGYIEPAPFSAILTKYTSM